MKRKKISIDTDPTQIVTDRGRSARTALGLRTRKSPASHITQSTHLTPSSAHLLGCECNNRLHCAQLIVPKNLRVTRCTQQHPPTYSTLQMEIRLDILPKLITDLPDEPMQIVFSSLGPKDIVFWSWVDKNCQRKVLQGDESFMSYPEMMASMTMRRHQPLLQEIHTEYKNKNHRVILWYKFLNKTKHVGLVITYPLFSIIGLLLLHGSLFMGIMFMPLVWLSHLIYIYIVRFKVCSREPIKEIPGDRPAMAPEVYFIEGEGPSHPKTIIFNLLWLTFGLGFLVILSFFLIGVLQMVTIVGISSGLETMRLTWYLMWPCGYQYFLFDGEYISKAEREREERLLDLKMRYNNQHATNTSSSRHHHFV